MRRYRSCLIALTMSAIGCTLLMAHEQQTSDDVAKQIQGTWKFVAHEMDGKSATKEEMAKMRITFTGNKFAVTDDGKLVQEGTQKFDPSKKPAHLDSTVTEGEGKGTTMLGIFELTDDTIKVCFDPAGKDRPTSFTAKAGQLSATIQREKK